MPLELLIYGSLILLRCTMKIGKVFGCHVFQYFNLTKSAGIRRLFSSVDY
jgi:hypothetical protein